MSDTAEPRKICGCQQETFIKIINMTVGLAMVVCGVFNMFNFVTAGANVVLAFGFSFY